MKGKERVVEMYVGVGDSSGGTWFVEEVRVDASLPNGRAIEVAYNKLWAMFDREEREATAFTGLYSIWDDSLMQELWDYEEEDTDE